MKIFRLPHNLRQTFILIALGFFIGQFCLKLTTDLPLKFILKDHLHLPPQAMAAFFAITTIPWYCKPLAGFLSDAVPIFGSKRRSYLLTSTLLASIACLWLGTVPQKYFPILVAVTLANTLLMIISSVLGGILVEVGQDTHTTGRFSMIRNVAFIGGTLTGSAVSGILVARPFIQTCAISAALLFVLVLLTLFFWQGIERPSTQNFKNPLSDFQSQWHTLRASKALWLVVMFQFFLYVAPGFNTPLLYYQTNINDFSGAFIGWLGVASGIAGVIGSFLYGISCRTLSLKSLLIISIVADALTSLGYLNYHTTTDAWIVESVHGLANGLSIVLVYDMAARVAPKGSEAVSYALIMAVHNLSVQGSDVIGSYMSGVWNITFEHLVPINAVTTLFTLMLIPLLPASLLAMRDGDKQRQPLSEDVEFAK